MQWLVMCSMLSAAALVSGQTPAAEWPQWRGPYNTGMADGDAPLKWDDQTNVRWKVAIPGRLYLATDIYLRSRTHLFRIGD